MGIENGSGEAGGAVGADDEGFEGAAALFFDVDVEADLAEDVAAFEEDAIGVAVTNERQSFFESADGLHQTVVEVAAVGAADEDDA